MARRTSKTKYINSILKTKSCVQVHKYVSNRGIILVYIIYSPSEHPGMFPHCNSFIPQLFLNVQMKLVLECPEEGCMGHYHGDPRVPEGEGQHHVSSERGDHGDHDPKHIPPRPINHEAQKGRRRGGDDVHNTGEDREGQLSPKDWKRDTSKCFSRMSCLMTERKPNKNRAEKVGLSVCVIWDFSGRTCSQDQVKCRCCHTGKIIWQVIR